MVLIPMVVGSAIGSLLIQTLGERAVVNGQDGVLPPAATASPPTQMRFSPPISRHTPSPSP